MARKREVIVRLLEKKTHVATACPHCGCSGRHVQWFLTASGERKGAMSGCLQNAFYIHPLALERARWEKRLERYPNWQRAIRAIEGIDNSVRVMFGVEVANA